MRANFHLPTLALLASVFAVAACSDDDDDGLSQAQQHGVGAECTIDDDCVHETLDLQCLNFKGGYCGLKDCQGDEDCPSGSACVAHDDGSNYCFLICTDKVQCNATRSVEFESNCSANITFVDPQSGIKACVPPS